MPGTVRSQVRATFSPTLGHLRIEGDASDNRIDVAADPAGVIIINGGAVVLVGGVPTTRNTRAIEVLAHGGDGYDAADGGDGRDRAIGCERVVNAR